MDQAQLSSRAIIGMDFARMEANPGLVWVNAISNLFTSDQASEDYKFLGFSPAMREWIAGRQAKGLRGNEFSIINKHYEATLEIARRDLRRDKTAQILARVEEFADRAATHWPSLLSTLIVDAESTVCYDGQFFFDTDHSEGASGSQSNDISVTIANLPVAVHGSTTNPSVEEMQQVILQGITQILGFKDDQGEPMNENATSFIVKVPMSLYMTALAAVSTILNAAKAQNMNPASLMNVQIVPNARLTWTTKIAIFRTDSPVKGLIRQSEQDIEFKAKAEGSEFEFDNDAWQFGIDSWRNVGYGYWQRACLVTMA
jgi:phage major head subunit gpT-like protein